MYWRCLVSEGTNTALLIVPLMLLWWLSKSDAPLFYGWSAKGFDGKPYAWMLAFMFVLIMLYSAIWYEDYSPTYPRVQRLISIDEFPDLPWWQVISYEFVYLLNFIGVEHFFRGFLIMAFAVNVG